MPIVVLFLAGCFGSHAVNPDESGILLERDAAKNTSYVLQTTDAEGRRRFFVCAEPPPDAAQDEETEANANGGVVTPAGVDSTLAMGYLNSQMMKELSGRTELVVLTRELLFRTCEAAINFNGDDLPDNFASHYDAILSVVQDIAAAERADAEARADIYRVIAENLNADADKLIKQLETTFISGSSLKVQDWKDFVDSIDDADVQAAAAALKVPTDPAQFRAQLQRQSIDLLRTLANNLADN